MYVYVSNKGNIILKSYTRVMRMLTQGYKEYQTNYSLEDNLIFERGQVVRYENSKQWEEDNDIYHTKEELRKATKKNEELTLIANTKIEKEKWVEATELQRKIYLLNSLKNAKKSMAQ